MAPVLLLVQDIFLIAANNHGETQQVTQWSFTEEGNESLCERENLAG